MIQTTWWPVRAQTIDSFSTTASDACKRNDFVLPQKHYSIKTLLARTISSQLHLQCSRASKAKHLRRSEHVRGDDNSTNVGTSVEDHTQESIRNDVIIFSTPCFKAHPPGVYLCSALLRSLLCTTS